MDIKSRNGEKFEIFSNFLAHRVETPWPILTVLHQNVRRSVPYILTTFGIAQRNRNGSCPMHEWDHPPIFWVFNSPSPVRQGAMDPRGRGHVGRYCPYTNKIWCGSVHALLKYRSKTAKMQKIPHWLHSNENFICLFFRPLRKTETVDSSVALGVIRKTGIMSLNFCLTL